MIVGFSFTSTAHVTQQSNYLNQQAEILSRRSTLMPQRAKNTVNDLSVVSGTEVTLNIKHSQFPLISSRDRQAAVCSLLRMEVILPNTSLLLNTLRQKNDLMKQDLIDILAPPFANRQNCSHNRTAKLKNLLSSSRVVTKPFMTFMNTSTSKLLFHLVYRVLDFQLSGSIARNRSIFLCAFTSTTECPDILRMSSILHPTEFAAFSLL